MDFLILSVFTNPWEFGLAESQSNTSIKCYAIFSISRTRYFLLRVILAVHNMSSWYNISETVHFKTYFYVVSVFASLIISLEPYLEREEGEGGFRSRHPLNVYTRFLTLLYFILGCKHFSLVSGIISEQQTNNTKTKT